MMLLVSGVAKALTINKPVINDDHYTNLIDFDVNWGTSIIKCQYALNNQSNRTFDCLDTFIIDIPYHSGQANITLYATDNLDVVTDSTIKINLKGDNNTTRGLIGLGILFLTLFVSLLFYLIAIGLTYIETEPSEHWALKIGFMLLSIVMLFPAFNVGNVLIRMYIHSDTLTSIISPYVYTWVFIIMLFMIFIYLIFRVFSLFSNRKHKTGDYDEE